jgi:hypothetical protein
MPLKKIADAPKFCHHPEHNPPSMIVLEPGTYEHTCPSCHAKIVFRVDGVHLNASAGSLTWPRSSTVIEPKLLPAVGGAMLPMKRDPSYTFTPGGYPGDDRFGPMFDPGPFGPKIDCSTPRFTSFWR